MLIIRQKKLGSDRLPGDIADMVETARSRCDVRHTSEDVRDITATNGRITVVITNRKSYSATHVIQASGRAGANWMSQLATLIGCGEVQADTAVSEETTNRLNPFNRLGLPANVPVFPNLDAGNFAYKLLNRQGGARAVGPF